MNDHPCGGKAAALLFEQTFGLTLNFIFRFVNLSASACLDRCISDPPPPWTITVVVISIGFVVVVVNVVIKVFVIHAVRLVVVLMLVSSPGSPAWSRRAVVVALDILSPHDGLACRPSRRADMGEDAGKS